VDSMAWSKGLDVEVGGHAWTQIRICLQNPDEPPVAELSVEEGGTAARAAEIREALAIFGGLRQNGAEVRLHRAVLYNSIYRADNRLLVAQHLYGLPADREPVLDLRSAASGDMAATYIDVFERTWAGALHRE